MTKVINTKYVTRCSFIVSTLVTSLRLQIIIKEITTNDDSRFQTDGRWIFVGNISLKAELRRSGVSFAQLDKLS